jgi:serine O-acetyltransferase
LFTVTESWVDRLLTARKLTRVNTAVKSNFSALGCIGGDLRAKARWLYESESAGARMKTLLTDGTFAMVVYRFMQASQRAGLTPLAMFFNKLNVVFGQCIIGRGAEFGAQFVLIHSQGVVINTGVRGGEKIFIEHQVTIGAEKRTAPVLGNGVFVGAGAKILGTVRLGNDVKVGANAVVTKDVPDGATVVGIPARVVRLHGKVV